LDDRWRITPKPNDADVSCVSARHESTSWPFDTDVCDVVGVLHFRELVGHSDRGILINAVARWIPDRIRRLVYADVSVPRDGESNNDVR